MVLYQWVVINNDLQNRFNQLMVVSGFVEPMNFCCGSYYRYHINCGNEAIVNGTVYGNPCHHPSRHISWDGIHYSQAANLWVANHILRGSFSDPSISIDQVCLHPTNM